MHLHSVSLRISSNLAFTLMYLKTYQLLVFSSPWREPPHLHPQGNLALILVPEESMSHSSNQCCKSSLCPTPSELVLHVCSASSNTSQDPGSASICPIWSLTLGKSCNSSMPFDFKCGENRNDGLGIRALKSSLGDFDKSRPRTPVEAPSSMLSEHLTTAKMSLMLFPFPKVSSNH